MKRPTKIFNQTPMGVAEYTDDHSEFFGFKKSSRSKDITPLHLYVVALSDNSSTFVLAEDEKSAIWQASCGLKKDMENNATAILVPFRIQGWYSTMF